MVDFWRRRVGNYGCLLSSSSRYLKLAVRREFNVICSFFLQNLTQFSIFFFFFLTSDVDDQRLEITSQPRGWRAVTLWPQSRKFIGSVPSGNWWFTLRTKDALVLEVPVAACCYRISWAKLFFSHLTCDSYCGIGQRWKWAWLDPTCHRQLLFFSSLQMGVITTGLTLSPLNTFPFLPSRSSTQKLL